MPERRIVAGQRVDEATRESARILRKEMTPAETVLWEALRSRRLDGIKFRRQQPIDGFVVDFYCHEAGLFLEVDGGIHGTQKEADEERESIIKRRELRCLRFSNEEVLRSLPSVLDRIRATCKG